jgi:uncharacterized protein (TIGR03437 family)
MIVRGDRALQLGSMILIWLAAFAVPQAFAQSNPPLISFATYLAPNSYPAQVVADPSGYVYVSGYTESPDFPCTLPAASPPSVSSPNAFITKFRPNGSGVAWTACFAGAYGAVLAVDRAGSIYAGVNSATSSSLTKLDSAAGAVLFSYSIASAGIGSIAFDSSGNIYVAGAAGSGFVTTPGSAYPVLLAECASTPAPCTEAFIETLSPTQNAASPFVVQYATYTNQLGYISGIAIDSTGAAWAAGTSPFYLPESTYGTTGFILKLDPSGSEITFSTHLGGGLFDNEFAYYAEGLGIAVDSNDFAYATGVSDFFSIAPLVTPGTLPRPTDPSETALYPYARKLDPSGNTVYMTFLGDVTQQLNNFVAVDAAGNAYFSLFSNVWPPNLISCGNSGIGDGFSTVTVLSADASRIVASGVAQGVAYGLFLDQKGGLYLTGNTNSSAFLATPGAYLTQYPSGATAFLEKLDFSQPAGPSMTCMVNAGSFWSGRNTSGFNGGVAPGEIVTLFGQLFPTGPGLSVTFDGKPAPILYADSSQINAVVPFATPGPFTMVSITNGAQGVGPYQLPVNPAVPGLFTIGTGTATHLAALNQDYSINSSSNPAAPGSIVSLFMTGVGAYAQTIADGTSGPLEPPFPMPILGVSAMIAGKPAEVLFAGQAPGLIAGAAQVNVQVPNGAPAGTAAVVVYVGAYPTPSGQIFVGTP